eukprot:scaffold320_cov335-Pavlova_lutheri.AAC.33
MGNPQSRSFVASSTLPRLNVYIPTRFGVRVCAAADLCWGVVESCSWRVRFPSCSILLVVCVGLCVKTSDRVFRGPPWYPTRQGDPCEVALDQRLVRPGPLSVRRRRTLPRMTCVLVPFTAVT